MTSFKHTVVCINGINPIAIECSIWCLAARRAVNFGTKKLQYFISKCVCELASCWMDDWRRDVGRKQNMSTVTI